MIRFPKSTFRYLAPLLTFHRLPMTSRHDDHDDATTASAGSSSNENIDVTISPAAIDWLDDNGQRQSLSHAPSSTHDHVKFDLKFEAESGTALFKVKTNVSLRGKRNKSNVYFFIHPEHIQSLSLVNDNEDGEISSANTLGTTAYTLHFALSAPAVFVVPADGCVPKNEATRSTLLLLQDLAKRTSFNVAFPTKTLSKDQLTVVCNEVSSPGRITTTPGLFNLSKLYGGKGGRVAHGGDDELEKDSELLAETNPRSLDSAYQSSSATGLKEKEVQGQQLNKTRQGQGEDVFSPPSYNELDGDASLPNYPRTGSKRRRVGSDASHGAGKESSRLEEICRRGFGEIGSRLDRIEQSLGHLGSRLDRVEGRMFAIESQVNQSCSSEQKDGQSGDWANRIEGVEGRVDDVEKRLDAGLSELATDVENQIYDVRHEVDDMIFVRISDEMGVVQSEMEDFVKDEMHNCAEDIEHAVRDRLRDAL